MVSKPGWSAALLCCLGLCLLVTGASAAPTTQTASVPKQDRSWKRYRNPQLNYCLSYPARWLRGDAFDGEGFYMETGVKKYSRPLGEIDVGALPFLSDTPHTSTASLIENVQLHLDGLKNFERAENMEVLEKRSMHFLGSPAAYIKDRYYDPQDRHTWVDEVIFVQRTDRLFRFELECSAEQLARFESVFTHLLDSFQFECGTAR